MNKCRVLQTKMPNNRIPKDRLFDLSSMKPVTIELAGKMRHLFYDLNALRMIEKEMKIELKDLLPHLLARGWLGDIRILLWAGLIHEDPILR